MRWAPYDSSCSASPSGEPLGSFDPYTSVLRLRSDVAAALDHKDGALPDFSVESGESPALQSFSTHLHETLHWWQHVGTTCGFLHSIGDATIALSCSESLRQSQCYRKPLIRALYEQPSFSDSGRSAILQWRDIENGRSVTFDPKRSVALWSSRPERATTVGHSLLSYCSLTMGTLARLFDSECEGLLDPTPWDDAYRAFESDRRVGFDPNILLEIPLGMVEIAEGQARISEIQHRNLTQRALSWATVMNDGWLDGIYGRAFNLFLKLTESSEPTSPRDDIVDLFLLICDVALNPSCGYVDNVGPEQEFVLDFHPGARFLRICRAVLREQLDLTQFSLPSLSGYLEITKRLCEPLGWITPVQVAERGLAMWASSACGSELAHQHLTRGYGSVDLPLRYLVGEHRSYLETKAQIPHVLCWPAWFLILHEEDSEDYAATIDEMLGWHRPPFTADGSEGVSSIEIPRLDEAQVPQFASDYFTTLALYDLVIQWIAMSGQFELDGFSWTTNLSTHEKTRIGEQFLRSFGKGLNEIEALPA